jgi:hypothetical protein
MKVLAIAALLCPLVSASSCPTGSSVADEVSLMQKSAVLQQRPAKDLETTMLLSTEDIMQLVRNAEEQAFKEAEEEVQKHGDEEKFVPSDFAEAEIPLAVAASREPEWDSGSVTDEAILDSSGSTATVQDGSVTAAWEAALGKTKAGMKAASDDSIAFKEKVHDQRKADTEATAVKVAANRNTVKEALEADVDGVRAAFKHRLAVKKAAILKMERAREAFEVAAAKKHETADYAVAGRIEGAAEGLDDAAATARSADEVLAMRRAAFRKGLALAGRFS